jgi:hypothetical protein
MPHVQREQHQPLKSSPSTRIKRLFIHLPLRAFGILAWARRGGRHHASSAEVNSCPPENILHWKRSPDQVTKVLLPT